MNHNESNKFDWGETVKITDTAPPLFKPGEIVSVCGITKVTSELLANRFQSHIGEWVYTVEYLGGADMEKGLMDSN